MKSAATNARNYRTFLLVAQLEAGAIGARIAQARNEAGLTQEELADLAVGFSRRSLQDYETGVTIPYKHMQEIASLVAVTVEWLLHGEPDEATPQDADAIALLRAEMSEIRQLLDDRLPPHGANRQHG